MSVDFSNNNGAHDLSIEPDLTLEIYRVQKDERVEKSTAMWLRGKFARADEFNLWKDLNGHFGRKDAAERDALRCSEGSSTGYHKICFHIFSEDPARQQEQEDEDFIGKHEKKGSK